MSGNPNASERYLATRGYIPGGPTRARLREYTSHGVTLSTLMELTGSKRHILFNLHRGRNQRVHQDIAAAIDSLDFNDVVDMYGTPAPYVDDVCVDRILAGDPVIIAAHDKPEYARRLYTAHGWTKSRIADRLGISGARINLILGIEAAA